MTLLCILSESYLCDRQFICLVKSKQYPIYKLRRRLLAPKRFVLCVIFLWKRLFALDNRKFINMILKNEINSNIIYISKQNYIYTVIFVKYFSTASYTSFPFKHSLGENKNRHYACCLIQFNVYFNRILLKLN